MKVISKNHKNLFKGFTLIELLVVIAIIAILAFLIILRISDAIKDSKYSRAAADMDQIKKAMLKYRVEKGQIPPYVIQSVQQNSINTLRPCDGCPEGDAPDAARWALVMDELVNGGYLSSRIDKDPWGSPYAYHDHDCQTNHNPPMNPERASYIWSVGPDRINGSYFNDVFGANPGDDSPMVEITGGCTVG